MPKYYKKGTLGRMIEAEGGSSDPDLAEVRMSNEEFRDLWDRVKRAENAADYAREKADKREDEVREKAKREIEEYKQNADADARRRIEIAEQKADDSAEEVLALREQLAQMAIDLQNEKKLYSNMLRIMKERANQERGISPKKRHDGYVVLESRQWIEQYTTETWDTEDHKRRYGEGNDRKAAIRKGYLCIDHKTASVWKSIIQTPYDASIPLTLIRRKIENDDLRSNGILRDIGCEEMSKKKDNGIYRIFGKSGKTINGLYKWVYRANYRSGLWEMEIYTTENLQVPAYRRPSQRVAGNGAKRKNIAAERSVYHIDDSRLDETWDPDEDWDLDE